MRVAIELEHRALTRQGQAADAFEGTSAIQKKARVARGDEDTSKALQLT